jgi:glyoxylase-like metal-dependent hydrolase (beta-lactamase superfamily II)
VSEAPVLRWQVGQVRVTKVVELEMAGGSRFLLPQATPEEVRKIEWLAPHFADERGRLKLSIHALIIETPTRRILVDTCLGNDKQGRSIPHWNARQGTFLADLAAAGYPAESIDTVLCTHLHVDHVGWNTRLVDGKWVPSFPRARYLFGRKEFEHWQAQEARADMRTVFEDSVRPIVEAGLAELVEVDHRLCEEVSLMPTHGHTPGHVSVRIASGGEEAVITGDLAHHPCQMAHPHWNSTADMDPPQAERTRRDFFAGMAGKPVLVIGTHFAGPTAGRVARDGEGFRLLVCW